jgi:hypothetical protein
VKLHLIGARKIFFEFERRYSKNDRSRREGQIETDFNCDISTY